MVSRRTKLTANSDIGEITAALQIGQRRFPEPIESSNAVREKL